MEMNLFHRLLRLFGLREVSAQTSAPAPATASEPQSPRSAEISQSASAISYDPHLIQRLTADHREIVCLYGEIVAANNRGEYSALPPMIRTFKLDLQRHLMVENVRLYAYLTQGVAVDSGHATFIGSAKREMDGIARSVVRFVNGYDTTDAIAANAGAFKTELEAMGEVLSKRIALEETSLYVLYVSDGGAPNARG